MLEVEKLTKKYGDRIALDGASFAVKPGEMFGFVGPNGAGKTTTMRIVLGVLHADAGERWQGRPPDAETRRRFGYMPEERGLYAKMRVRDQLEYLARLHGVDQETARRNVDDCLHQLGLRQRGQDRLEALSLGNQQRIQLAAALTHEPPLLVLDEPFSGLDPVGVDTLADVLRHHVQAGAAVVFSSHQLELVERLCDAVGIISAGRMVATGPVDEVRSRESRRRIRVVTRGAPATWPEGVTGVRTIEANHDRGQGGLALVLELDQHTDDQAVLDRARAAGAVQEFTPLRPTLAELFRSAVAA